MLLSELTAVLEEIAPTRLAEAWDNVGLLVGDPAQTVHKILLTIDYTTAVADEAERDSCDLVIAYHPPIFKALKRIAAGSVVHRALRRGMAIYSPHTALDVAEGGTNDVLADVLRLIDRAPLRTAGVAESRHLLVTFVPEGDVAEVAAALAAAGALASVEGGGFRTNASRRHRSDDFTTSDETRLEAVVPIARVEAVLRALRESHSGEEVVFDLLRIASPPSGLGLGRIGTLASPMERSDLLDDIRAELGVERLLVAGPTEGTVRRAAVGAGACGDLIDDAIAQGADLYLTGEVRHHDALRAAEAGMTVVCALHSNSERAALRRLKLRLDEQLEGVSVQVSREDRDPFRIV